MRQDKINSSLIMAVSIIAFLVLAAILVLIWYNMPNSTENNGYNPPVYSNNTDNAGNLCYEEGRDSDFCTEQYDPVCGWFNQNIQCIKYPCAQTYSNSCFACLDDKVEYWTKGQCPA
ncbi:MAG: hypothetical protein Q8Q31_03145 [Nanoarchaeota archaeon]|nr:hypothetical protein [Nanoarchaeota archaeon]